MWEVSQHLGVFILKKNTHVNISFENWSGLQQMYFYWVHLIPSKDFSDFISSKKYNYLEMVKNF